MKRFLANLYWLIAIFLHTQKVIPMNLTTDQLTALQTKTSALIDAAQAQATTDANLAAASAALNAAQAADQAAINATVAADQDLQAFVDGLVQPTSSS